VCRTCTIHREVVIAGMTNPLEMSEELVRGVGISLS
jgi:hypothetical protein